MERGDVGSASLVRNLLDLEKDFKYNLTLLRIRDEEIERCSQVNKTLHDKLQATLSEMCELKEKIVDLKGLLYKAEQDRSLERQNYHQSVCKLTEEIRAAKREHQANLEELRRQSNAKEERFEREMAETLRKRDASHRQSLMAFEERLKKERVSSDKLRKKLEELTLENGSLRNQIRAAESKRTSERSFYDTELESARTREEGLIFEKDHHQSHIAKLESQLLAAEEESRFFMETMSNLINCDREAVMRCEELEKRVREKEEENKRLAKINGELENNLKERKSGCSMQEHANYQQILTQNALLQEVVKAMRKERVRSASSDEDLNLKEAEGKLDKMEEQLSVLKHLMLKNAQNDELAALI